MSNTKLSKDGKTILYRNTFSPDCENEWIDLQTFLTGLRFGLFNFDLDISQGLMDEYHEWECKITSHRQEKIQSSNLA